MPALLLLLRSPFLFGYAKSVPVNFKALRNPRRDMVWVAAAGPLAIGATPLAAGKHARIALVAETAADARDVMVEGESGILAVHPQEFRPLYEPSKLIQEF